MDRVQDVKCMKYFNQQLELIRRMKYFIQRLELIWLN